MSERLVKQKQNTTVRTMPLNEQEKKSLTHLLNDFMLCPHTGKVVLHINNGAVSRVEPQLIL